MSSTPTPPLRAERLPAQFDPVPAALAAAAGIGLLVQLLLPPAPLPALNPAPRVRPGGGMATPIAAPAAPVSEQAIVSRSLFSASRSSVALQTAAPSGAFALLGVALAGRHAFATLRDSAGGLATVAVGQQIEGWRLEAVAHDSATLRNGAKTQTLRLGETPLQPPAASMGAGPARPKTPDTDD